MPLPCPSCGSNEAFWSTEVTSRPGCIGAILSFFTSMDSAIRSHEQFKKALPPNYPEPTPRVDRHRIEKRWHCPVCGESGIQASRIGS